MQLGVQLHPRKLSHCCSHTSESVRNVSGRDRIACARQDRLRNLLKGCVCIKKPTAAAASVRSIEELLTQLSQTGIAAADRTRKTGPGELFCSACEITAKHICLLHTQDCACDLWAVQLAMRGSFFDSPRIKLSVFLDR
jgi:hypothetical protein